MKGSIPMVFDYKKHKNPKVESPTHDEGLCVKKIEFNIHGLLLLFIIMVPNFVWFAIKAPNDILRVESVTPTLDLIASIFQIIMVVFLCFSKDENNKFNIYSIISIILYFTCWILYYMGITNSLAIIGLCLFPCLSFLFYEIKIKNWIAMIPTIVFTILHLLYGVINFI